MKNIIQKLRFQVKESAAQGADLQRQISVLRAQPDTGSERHQLWIRKKAVGAESRRLLLAYALLRGRPYAQLEPKCHEKASAWWIEQVIHGAFTTKTEGADGKVIKTVDPRAAEWTEKRIQAWLDGAASSVPAAEAAA